MRSLKHKTLFFISLLAPLLAFPQVEMADDFRGEGKIYVVIAVILTLLIGFFYLLWRLDKKSKRLEQEVTQRSMED